MPACPAGRICPRLRRLYRQRWNCGRNLIRAGRRLLPGAEIALALPLRIVTSELPSGDLGMALICTAGPGRKRTRPGGRRPHRRQHRKQGHWPGRWQPASRSSGTPRAIQSRWREPSSRGRHGQVNGTLGPQVIDATASPRVSSGWRAAQDGCRPFLPRNPTLITFGTASGVREIILADLPGT